MDAITTNQETTSACTVYSKRIIFELLLIFRKNLTLSRENRKLGIAFAEAREHWTVLELREANRNLIGYNREEFNSHYLFNFV